MASPFRTFRKNQKVWMAGITIMAIVAFVFLGGPMLSMNRLGSREPAAIQTKFGSLNQSQINSLRDQRKLLHQFVDLLRANLGSNNQQAANVTGAVYGILGEDTDDMAVQRWIYARTAESMGVAIDDKAVNDLLTQMMIGVAEPQKTIEAVLQAIHANQPQIFDIMRQQLLAIRLMQLGHQYDDWAGNSATPGERWDYFKRFHQRASVEVAVLQPKNYVKEVKDPTSDQLKQFFDKYKELEPSPDSPQPGFRVPRTVNIEYLESDPENYESQITEADITKEYEKDPKKYARDKEDFEKQEKEDRDAREKEDKEAAAAKAAAEKKPATDSKPKESTPKEPTPPPKPETKSDTTPKASPAASPEAKPAASSDVKPAPAGGATPVPAKPAPSAAKPTGSSTAAPSSPFRLVAYFDDKTADKTPPAVTEKNSAAKSPEVKNSEAKSPEKKDAAAPPTPKAATEQKAVDNKQPATESKTSSKSDSKSEAKQDTSKKADESKAADSKSAAADPDKKDSAAKDAAKKEERQAHQNGGRTTSRLHSQATGWQQISGKRGQSSQNAYRLSRDICQCGRRKAEAA